MAPRIVRMTEEADGLRVRVRRSKTDQEGQGAEKAIPHGRFIRPVALLREWLDAARITEGPLFQPVSRSGRVRAIADFANPPRLHGAHGGAPEGKRNGNFRYGNHTKELTKALKQIKA